jgi:hypothetical protein
VFQEIVPHHALQLSQHVFGNYVRHYSRPQTNVGD